MELRIDGDGTIIVVPGELLIEPAGFVLTDAGREAVTVLSGDRIEEVH